MKVITKRLTNVRVSLFVIALLTGILINSGELGTFDVDKRLQVAHSWWTDEPSVMLEDYPSFGLVGRDGRLFAWYGLGQSVVMLPADILASNVLKAANVNGELEIRARRAIVSLLTFPLLTALIVLVANLLLLEFGFPPNQAAIGALALLFGTTLFNYTQNNQENSLLLLMTLSGFLFVYRWIQTNSKSALFFASCALGFNLLTRLTTAFDLLVVTVFACLVLWRKIRTQNDSWSVRDFLKPLSDVLIIVVPTIAVSLLIDRIYHWARFGTWVGTYIGIYGEQRKLLDPTLPATFPFDKPFSEGFFGALISPEKSIFLFDPLLLITLILVVKFWRHLTPAVQSFVGSSLLLLIIYITFYARYAFWEGGSAWGNRFLTVPVQLLALLAVPLLLKFNQRIRAAWEKRFYLSIVILSIVTQLASVVLWFQLEENQIAYFRRATYAVGLRFTNLAAIITGNFEAWNLSYPGITPRMTMVNFMPFLAAKFLPASLAVALQLAWCSVLVILIAWTVFFVTRCFHQMAIDGSS